MTTALIAGIMSPLPTAAAPLACDDVAGFPNEVDRTDFCVYFTASTTTAEATTVADHVQDYWDRYETALTFREPKHSGKLQVLISSDASCNGVTSSGSNQITVNQGCFADARSIQKVTGHELFHRVQYSYDGSEVKWFKEGTARAMEDLAFTNIDQWPGTLSAPSSSFNKQVNDYLSNTNADITSEPMRYNSALWWKYFTEQFGTVTTEPERGVDAMRRLWEAAETKDDVAALNSALGTLGGPSFDTAFQRFAAANWVKDLSNQPSAAYNYLDEDEVGNGAPFGPIVPTNGGTINMSTAATVDNQSLSRYGARYFRATPSSTDCPIISAKFHTDAGPAFYHIVTQKGSALDTLSSSSATDYTRAFFNDGLTSVVAIAGSTNAAATADIKLECVTPIVDIKLPNSSAVAKVGPFDGPGKILAQVLVTNGNPKGPVVSGFTVNDFKAKVNGQNALIAGGGFIQEQYWLVIEAPVQTANGVYDLEVSLEKFGGTTVIASDTNPSSVSYDNDRTDHVLVLDRSGSMSSDNKMVAARQAAKFYVDITRLNDGVGVVPFNSDVSPAPFTLRAVTAAPNVRQQAKDYIDTITPSGLTSIGDGMAEAATERTASPTSNPDCSYVLLSDGMENSPQLWASVQASVQATHCPVTAIAFGPQSDETLMQNIATATGGQYFYNDVFVSALANGPQQTQALADTYLGLGDKYEFAQAKSEQRQRLLHSNAVMSGTLFSPLNVQTHTVVIDNSVSDALFALDWIPEHYLKATLFQPDGISVTQKSFVDYDSGHLGWRIANPMTGTWKIVVDLEDQCAVTICIGLANQPATAKPAAPSVNETPYQVIVSAKTDATLELLLPDRLGSRYLTGNRVPIFAIATNRAPILGLHPIAQVTAPNGIKTNVPLFDDGLHEDGAANDGLYGGFYTLVNQALPVPPTGEPGTQPTPNDEGSYQVRLLTQGNGFDREALGAFSVQEGPDVNGNGLPDPFEAENGVTQSETDPDLDTLDNVSEYQLGTNPVNSDTDGGGENDGSEFAKGKNPLDPTDDGIEAPQYLTVAPDVAANVVRYDVRPGYNRMVLYRATSPNGPWQVQEPELPTTGVYTDTATNGTPYYYRFMGIDADDDRSAIIGSTGATPSQDPFIPEAVLHIDEGVTTTTQLTVALTFSPLGDEPEDIARFNDISEVKLSNEPTFTGAAFQPFTRTLPWQLADVGAGHVATVYALLRDGAGNESLVLVDSIGLTSQAVLDRHIYLPMMMK